VNLDTTLLACLLRDLQPLKNVALEAFSKGMAISGLGNGFSVFALLAGIENGQTYEATKALDREKPAQQVRRRTKNRLITPAKNPCFYMTKSFTR
jgi:hypothetical protein